MDGKRLRGLPPKRISGAFTLVELLTSITILVVIVSIVFSVITQISKVLTSSTAKIDSFQNARTAFDLLTRNLSQATLNSYLDYDNPENPTRYWRRSELKFFSGCAGSAPDFPGTAGTGCACFFVLPGGYTQDMTKFGGAELLLNVAGYYISFAPNRLVPAHVAASARPYRYRLMQLLVPAEKNLIYTATGYGWFTEPIKDSSTGAMPFSIPVADNIVALIIRPQDPSADTPDLTTDYTYDSTLHSKDDPQPSTANQLPPLIQLTLVAISEASAKRLEKGTDQPSVIAQALDGKFSDTQKYSDDLKKLEKALADSKIEYRIFSGAIPIRESKWTK